MKASEAPEVYDFIIFRGQDIKDLTVLEGKASSATDPAIISVNQRPQGKEPKGKGEPGGVRFQGVFDAFSSFFVHFYSFFLMFWSLSSGFELFSLDFERPEASVPVSGAAATSS